MLLDIPTLMLAGSFVALLSGAMLVFAWHQYREMSPVLWWAASDFVLAPGIAFLAFGGVQSSQPLLAAGFVCVVLSPGLLWTSARLFNGLRPRFSIVASATAAMVAVNAMPLDGHMQEVRGGLSTLLNAGFLIAAAWTLTAKARQPLASRWPLAGFILAHACVLLTGPVAAAKSAGAPIPGLMSLFGMIHFEALVFLVGSTIFLVASMRESSELHHKRAASTDALTGLANRGSLLEKAERVAERCRQDRAPYAVIMLDLDHFKAVNDGHGHAVGDRTLQLFAETARKALRPNDLLGRLGGEEFVAVLPGTDLSAASALGERIRKAFAAAGLFVDGRQVTATVSAGVSATDHADIPFETLLQNADAALYRAKANGRNRVESDADGRQLRQLHPKLVRVA